MFDVGFSELLLVLVIGLVLLGPKRLPVAVRAILNSVKVLRSFIHSVKDEISHELKVKDLQIGSHEVGSCENLSSLNTSIKDKVKLPLENDSSEESIDK